MTDSLNVASPDCAEGFFAGRQARCVGLRHAAGLADLRAVLERHRGPAASLNLIGHSTRQHHLLRLGDTPIDMLNPVVARFFRAAAGDGLLAGAGIVAVRLLGCETAVTEAGRRTLRMLAQTLRMPVYGTRVPLLKSHSGPAGFNPVFSHLLVEAAHLPTEN
ncbi:hypothetical protein [Actinoplanes sp. NPDC026670]|uniref:hypothetical protein n=1 Tax=Actinoplanes sp. NPDC026670 TaxID=3154700 RepID=UPI0033F2384F